MSVSSIKQELENIKLPGRYYNKQPQIFLITANTLRRAGWDPISADIMYAAYEALYVKDKSTFSDLLKRAGVTRILPFGSKDIYVNKVSATPIEAKAYRDGILFLVDKNKNATSVAKRYITLLFEHIKALQNDAFVSKNYRGALAYIAREYPTLIAAAGLPPVNVNRSIEDAADYKKYKPVQFSTADGLSTNNVQSLLVKALKAVIPNVDYETLMTFYKNGITGITITIENAALNQVYDRRSIFNQLSTAPSWKGSPSFLQKVMAKLVSVVTGKPVAPEYNFDRQKVQHVKQTKQDVVVPKPVNIPMPGPVGSLAADANAQSPCANPADLMNTLNGMLHDYIKDDMHDSSEPSSPNYLRYQTGRFANSATILSVSPNCHIEYTYMIDPYALVYNGQGGRDTDAYVERAIDKIMRLNMINRFTIG